MSKFCLKKRKMRGVFAQECRQKNKSKRGIYMKKVLGKITGIVLAAAMTISALSVCKVEVKAAQAINVNQEYRVVINGEEKQEFTFVTPQDAITSIEAVVADANMGLYSTSLKLTVDYCNYWSGSIRRGEGKIESQSYVFQPGHTATFSISNGLKSLRSEVVFKINCTHVDNLEKEGNNAAGTATKIKAGKTYTGVVTKEDSDVDWYVFKAPKTGKYRFYAVNTVTDGSLNNVSIEGFKSKTKKDSNFSQYLRAGAGWSKSKAIKLKKGKKYYVRISGAHFRSIPVQLRVKKVK